MDQSPCQFLNFAGYFLVWGQWNSQRQTLGLKVTLVVSKSCTQCDTVQATCQVAKQRCSPRPFQARKKASHRSKSLSTTARAEFVSANALNGKLEHAETDRAPTHSKHQTTTHPA
eukprot:2668688-Amphidinium_carterae.1